MLNLWRKPLNPGRVAEVARYRFNPHWFWFCVSEGSQLVAPDNVTMATLNTNYTLRWDWDRSWSQDVTFTAAYIP